jgi:hypothetical protein
VLCEALPVAHLELPKLHKGIADVPEDAKAELFSSRRHLWQFSVMPYHKHVLCELTHLIQSHPIHLYRIRVLLLGKKDVAHVNTQPPALRILLVLYYQTVRWHSTAQHSTAQHSTAHIRRHAYQELPLLCSARSLKPVCAEGLIVHLIVSVCVCKIETHSIRKVEVDLLNQPTLFFMLAQHALLLALISNTNLHMQT